MHMCIQVARAKEIMRPFILRRLKKEVRVHVYRVYVRFLHTTCTYAMKLHVTQYMYAYYTNSIYNWELIKYRSKHMHLIACTYMYMYILMWQFCTYMYMMSYVCNCTGS